MHSLKFSKTFYRFKPQFVFEKRDWAKRHACPEYDAAINVPKIPNELIDKYPVIHLHAISKPLQTFAFYFTPEKVNQLRKEIRHVVATRTINERAIVVRSEGLSDGNQSDELLERMDDFEKSRELGQNLLDNKNFQTLQLCVRIYRLKTDEKLSVRDIASILGVSQNRVTYLWRELRTSSGTNLNKYISKVKDELILIEEFPRQINRHFRESPSCT